VIYPFMDDAWQPNPRRRLELLELVAQIGGRAGHVLGLSIDLGGMLVLAGNEAGLAAFEAAVPPVQGRFPMRLANHAGFHTALQEPVAAAGRAALSPALFGQPDLPLIDGRGAIWWPQATDTAALWDYTLGHQVVEPYDFTRAIRTAAREFAPDLFIVTGPGTTLGGAVAQSLILSDWQGMGSKGDFQRRQAAEPLLVSMGMAEQRGLVV
jgi:acyl transferase domain-containing protein